MLNFINSDAVFDAFFYMNAKLWKEATIIRGIFNTLWEKIPYNNKAKIVGNLEFIICAPILNH